ncbi:MAG: PspA/IM30 family protein [Thermomicrobia bacterium]|nr:PspA/IM30 family protein [Thermomicrobia bacterium]
MGILDRMTRLIRANVNDMVDHAEDPAKMLDQLIREMNDQIHMARGQVAAMIAQEKELQMDYEQSAKQAAEWDRKAELAVTQGKDDLAREALRRKRDNDEHAQVYSSNLQSQQEMVAKLKMQLQQLETKYESARANRDVLIARQRRAEAVQKVSSTMSGLKSLEPGEELDRMERRIRSNEAKALAEQDLASDSMGAQFAELDSGLEVEDDLAKLKARVQGGQQAALSSGENMDELAALKARMGVHEGAALGPGEAQSTGMASATNTQSAQPDQPHPQTPPPGRQQQ